MSSQVAVRARERISLADICRILCLLILRRFRSCLRFRPETFLKLVMDKMEVNSATMFVQSCGSWSFSLPFQATYNSKDRLWNLSRFTLFQVIVFCPAVWIPGGPGRGGRAVLSNCEGRYERAKVLRAAEIWLWRAAAL